MNMTTRKGMETKLIKEREAFSNIRMTLRRRIAKEQKKTPLDEAKLEIMKLEYKKQKHYLRLNKRRLRDLREGKCKSLEMTTQEPILNHAVRVSLPDDQIDDSKPEARKQYVSWATPLEQHYTPSEDQKACEKACDSGHIIPQYLFRVPGDKGILAERGIQAAYNVSQVEDLPDLSDTHLFI